MTTVDLNPGYMRYYCNFCGRPAMSPVPDDTIVRAILVCPECIQAGKIIFPEDAEE